MSIIFYDIPTKDRTPISPNAWKTRFTLNYKDCPYKTEWIEFPHIESRCKELGISATSTSPDGAPFYTLPAIHDPNTGAYISDSLSIAEYLEKTYPEHPLFPHNTIGIQSAFGPAFMKNVAPLWQFIAPAMLSKVSPLSEEYVFRTKSVDFGMPLDQLLPKGEKAVEEWKKFEAGLGVVDSWYAKTGSVFLMGNEPCWADFVVGSFVVEFPRTVFGEHSQQWKDIMSWHGGRWATLCQNLKKYEKIA
ncbi:hypothetical protein GALMADRAFT_74926 [Galerina marginata CBS 339.88]|uniref:GST N-terminal domain-containing protein n=1 Tax=Galerina marginata (strain CBS 339.88) TaxID=685588 RepID=A0A067SUY3_GALM3|nr:hypothetical protein GALMADRAFT_74926 [Galerina marginata CBS 339.88]